MQGNTSEASTQYSVGGAGHAGPGTGGVTPAAAPDPAAEARALADSILNPPAAGDEPGALATEPVPAPTKHESVVANSLPKGGAGKAAEPAEGQEGVHAGEGGAAPEESPVADLEAVLKGRSERVKARLQTKAQLQELEERVQAAQRAAQELEERAKKDPLGFLRGAGYTDEAIAKALLGEPASNPADPVQARLDKLERLLTEKQAQEQRALEAAKAAQLEQGRAAVKREFITHVAMAADSDYAHLAAYYDDAPDELAERALAIADKYREATGRDTSFEAVAQYLEQDLRTRYSRITQRQQPQSAGTGSAKSPPKGQTTLTATDAAPRSAPPKDPRDMTEEEARKEALKLANQLTRSKR